MISVNVLKGQCIQYRPDSLKVLKSLNLVRPLLFMFCTIVDFCKFMRCSVMVKERLSEVPFQVLVFKGLKFQYKLHNKCCLHCVKMGSLPTKFRGLSSLSEEYQKSIEKEMTKYERLKNLDLFVLDNSIRESTVGQTRGHTIEEKWKIYEQRKIPKFYVLTILPSDGV